MMLLSHAALATRGRLVGDDVMFDAVTTDSRQVRPGDLFVALRGERFDGHAFVADSLRQGAVAAMVDTPLPGDTGAQLVVTDTRLALGRLAAAWRDRCAPAVAAITGSNGKTTVKEMLASILRQAAGADQVLATEGNLNNDIGLPLTLLRLQPGQRFAVLEMGMNHAGEISYLTRLARPDVAVVNNAGPAHLEGLGSIEAVAYAKGEIFEGLSGEGVAVVNLDDPYASLWTSLAGTRRILGFGLDPAAEVSADYAPEVDGCRLRLKTPAGMVDLRLAVPGLHNVRNALAATAAAHALSIDLGVIARGLESYVGTRGRLQARPGRHGALVIDDSYNANPASMRAAVSVLAAYPGRRIFVMGDMGELGDDAAAMHAGIGALARSEGIDALYGTGPMTAGAVAAFGPDGRHYASVEALGEALQDELREEVTLLVKGSRFMRMERVVAALIEESGKETRHAA